MKLRVRPGRPILKVPTKHFVLGEYLALQGDLALVFAGEPFFLLGESSWPDSRRVQLDSRSPAGRLGLQELHISGGTAGGGGSTAEFLFAWLQAGKSTEDFWSLRRQYLELAPGSGYDLLAQLQGGWSWIQGSQQKIESTVWPFEHHGLLFFKTPRKLATHEHLRELGTRKFDSLRPPVEHALGSWKAKDAPGFFASVQDFAQELRRLELTHPETENLLRAFRHPAVLAKKGCGAAGADVILVAYDRTQVSAEELIEDAIRLDLQLIGTEASRAEGATPL